MRITNITLEMITVICFLIERKWKKISVLYADRKTDADKISS